MIKTIRKWHREDVQHCCIHNRFYTCGGNEDYERMLELVSELEPTPENIKTIARDIYFNSEGQTITNIMYCLEADAVRTFYELYDDNGNLLDI